MGRDKRERLELRCDGSALTWADVLARVDDLSSATITRLTAERDAAIGLAEVAERKVEVLGSEIEKAKLEDGQVEDLIGKAIRDYCGDCDGRKPEAECSAGPEAEPCWQCGAKPGTYAGLCVTCRGWRWA